MPNELEAKVSTTVPDVGLSATRARPAPLSLEELETASRQALLAACRALGLKRYSRLRKAALVERLRLELRRRAPKPSPERDEPADEPRLASPSELPWGYGVVRTRAMAVDPERLFVYWEVTDEAIAAAARRLGLADGARRLNLRVYDTTGRLFDGSNAHRHFDQPVPRNARQWFLRVDRPGSEAFVELGVRSQEGGFVRISRSRKVVFARRDPGPPIEPSWVTLTPDARTETSQERRSGPSFRGANATPRRGSSDRPTRSGERVESAAGAEGSPSEVEAAPGGASELVYPKSDERLHPGASDRLYSGASERLGSREGEHA